MSQQQQEHRLGELLIDVGFLQLNELDVAEAMVNRLCLPFGQRACDVRSSVGQRIKEHACLGILFERQCHRPR